MTSSTLGKKSPNVPRVRLALSVHLFLEESAWVIFNKGVYDITGWLDRHPGGKQMLLLTAGRDVTDLMPSYHPFSSKAEKV